MGSLELVLSRVPMSACGFYRPPLYWIKPQWIGTLAIPSILDYAWESIDFQNGFHCNDDMILDDVQDRLIQNVNSELDRNAIKGDRYPWPGGIIPYKVDESTVHLRPRLARFAAQTTFLFKSFISWCVISRKTKMYQFSIQKMFMWIVKFSLPVFKWTTTVCSILNCSH